MEYCGEVCTHKDFEARKLEYIKEKRRHYYFMSLTTDEVDESLVTNLQTKLKMMYNLLHNFLTN